MFINRFFLVINRFCTLINTKKAVLNRLFCALSDIL
nr:MAG TPA: Protein of unknown function (DUF2948) [Microviridae sp.]